MPRKPILPVITNQHKFNRLRWLEICAAPVLPAHDFRTETDKFGYIVVGPHPPTFAHGRFQFRLGNLLQHHCNRGSIVTGCPFSTSEGIKAADVIWISSARKKRALRDGLLEMAPEICVEVLSPSNTREEMMEKKRLYFESGAKEVWFCDLAGRMHFYLHTTPDKPSASALCPKFPQRL